MNRKFFIGLGLGWMCTVLVLMGSSDVGVARGADRGTAATASTTTMPITNTKTLFSPDLAGGNLGITFTYQGMLKVVATQSNAHAIEAYAQTSADGWGVYAVGTRRGVYGYSPYGVGVMGYSLYGPRGGIGVSGSGLTGVYGTGTDTGVSGNGIRGVYGKGIFGVRGDSTTSDGYGVYGSNTSGIGVFGVYSVSVGGEANAGVVGSSIAGSGVLGYSSKPTAPAIQGIHTGDGPAIYGSSGGAYPAIEGLRIDDGDAIGGFAASGTGVLGSSDTGVGIVARSTSGNIFEGHSLPANRRFYVSNGGYVYADGSYNCGLSSSCFNTGIGADVAERMDASETLQPGDLVEIDPAQPDRFRLARTANSTLVAGVVSTNPAVTMNNNDLADNDSGKRTDQRPLLALVGKVPVKASAGNGPIQIGDLLVASSTPGHVMKAPRHPEPGTVAGKALAPLKSGTGVILMLVTLQ